ncbi:hypothetical protein V1527DRAFT_163242 [Lipomyces starkeyi]
MLFCGRRRGLWKQRPDWLSNLTLALVLLQFHPRLSLAHCEDCIALCFVNALMAETYEPPPHYFSNILVSRHFDFIRDIGTYYRNCLCFYGDFTIVKHSLLCYKQQDEGYDVTSSQSQAAQLHDFICPAPIVRYWIRLIRLIGPRTG